MLSPRGIETRVRGLQSAGQPVTRIHAGERCALNLAGVELAQVQRGDWLLVPEMHAPTSRIEVRLRVLPNRREALKHNTSVHLHLGTANITARVLMPAQTAVAPSGEAVVQLVLDQPTCAATGDRFVVRDQSGRQLVGGGRVVDPFVSGDRRNQAGRSPIAAALQIPGAAQALAALLAIPEYEIDTQRFERCFNLETSTAQDLYHRSGAVLLGSAHTLALPATRVTDIGAQIVAALNTFHREHPEAGGMTTRDLRAALGTRISAQAFLVLQRDLSEKRLIETGGPLVRLAGFAANFSVAESALWQKAQRRLDKRGAQPFTARELASDLGTSEVIVKSLLYRRRSHGDVWPIADNRFMLRKQVAALAAGAAVLAKQVGGKGFTAAQYRDAIGTGRTLAIQILEFLDTVGVTHRNGDLRKMRPDYELVFGSAAPYVPAS
jgi:selenocysteine-specific elongation factor